MTRVVVCSDLEEDWSLMRALLRASGRGEVPNLVWLRSYEGSRTAMIREEPGAVFILGRDVEGGRVLDLLDESTALGRRAPILMLMDGASPDEEAEAIRRGAADVLTLADISGPRLRRAILHAVERVERETRASGLDPRTGLATPATLRDRLELALMRAKRARRGVAVLALRVEGIEPTMPGDGVSLRRSVADRIRLSLREMDTACRFDADQFLIVLEDLDQGGLAAYVAERLLHAMEHPFGPHADEQQKPIPSIGIATFPDDGEDPQGLIAKAQSALAVARRENVPTLRFASVAMNTTAARRTAIERALHGALERREFQLHYQPKIDLRTNELIGVEALLRWSPASLGNVPPGEFVPILEATSLIEPVGEWVLDAACTQAKIWVDEGAPLPVAVNVSPKQFRGRNLAELVRELLTSHGLPPTLLELELTEGVLLEKTQATYSTLISLRELGVRIAVDDFGTGYASLRYVKHFPMDAIKIDREFVRGVPEDNENVAITSSIIALAHRLGLEVTAEGVESENEAAFLRGLDCDFVQGYYHAKPMAVADFDAWRAARAVATTAVMRKRPGERVA